MKRVYRSYWIFLGTMVVLCVSADPRWLSASSLNAMWDPLLDLTGILGIAVMSGSMILSMRLILFERYLGGLGKLYRLHKLLGITGSVSILIHAVWAQIPRFARDPIVRDGSGHVARPQATYELWRTTAGLHQLADQLAVPAFLVTIVLIVVALSKAVPYRAFLRSHRLLPLTYCMLVVHSTLLMPTGYWAKGVGSAIAVLLVAGTLGAVKSGLGNMGWNRRTRAVMERTAPQSKDEAVCIAAALKDS